MHRLFLLWLLCSFSFSSFAHPHKLYRDIDPRLQLLKQQVLADIMTARPAEEEVAVFMNSLREDGSWPDINYADKTRGGWTVNDHLTRLSSMAVLYKKSGNRFTGNPEVRKKILAGLDYWLKNDFICPNWWYPQIGVPKTLAPLMLMMEESLSSAEMQAGVKILERSKIGMTGQNKVWLSGNVIYRSLLTGDVGAVEAAVSAIQDEIVVSEGEGIQADFSFHQHGTQQQFGNYGAAFAGDMLKWATIFQPTSFRFDAAKVAILRDYLLEGMRWIIWKNKMDISACGRQLFPHAQTEKANGIDRILQKMPLIDPTAKKEYTAALNSFSGNKHFWKSDMTVHRRAGFYASVKMSSRRVGGAESCNEENIQGYHLGDGATYFYQSNEEYTDIFPFWDWKMIPGTTTFHDEVPLPVLPCSGYNIASEFVGGVSDGSNGIATLSYKRDSLYAQKSWFFFNDAVVCLGAGIHSDEDKEVRSTVNQSYYKEQVMASQDGHLQQLNEGTHELSRVQWVLHDHWGYYFPGKAAISLTNQLQSGSWHRVLKRMPDSSMSAPLFTLWFNHHKKPTAAHYAYIVLPAADVNTIDNRGAAFQIISNDTILQAVENKSLQMAGLVFVQPGNAVTPIFGKISVQQPCVVMLTRKFSRLQLSVADPTHLLTHISITLKGKRFCGGVKVEYNSQKNETSLDLPLPAGAKAGMTAQYIVE